MYRVAFAIFLVSICGAQVIRTRDTVVTVAAQAGGARLVSLGSGTGEIWQNSAPETLIDSVSLDGRQMAVRWRLNRSRSSVSLRRVAFLYQCDEPKLELSWEWTARAAGGPVEHAIHIKNLSSGEIWVPLQDSFSFAIPVDPHTALKHFFVEKGAGKPSEEGTHLADLPVGFRWQGWSSTYAHPSEKEAREVIPFMAIEQAVGEGGWYAGVEFSGRTQLTVTRDTARLSGVVGLNPEQGTFRSRLKPGESFDTPTVFVGAFHGGMDGMGNELRPWVREVLGNPLTWSDPRYPVLVNNSWGSGMQVDEVTARRMIGDSAELGLEMFHLDAGWFRGVGDWYPDAAKFPHGLAAVADDAHRHRLKFGIWVDWTQAGLDTQPGALNLRDAKVRDWTVSDMPADWKPDEFKGQTIDIGVPAAHAYAKREVLRLVRDYHLDMLEHDGYLVAQGCVRTDHPHAAPDEAHIGVVKDEGSYFVESTNSTDVSYHATRAYYDIYEEARRRNPHLLLEVCNDGGRMVDFGSAAHGDYFSITDSYDPVSNRRAFYDASSVLPPAMLEAYVEKWPTPTIDNFRYMLRSGMMGWLTIMQDTNAWSAEQHAAAKREIEIYKRELRPLIRDADLYHIGARPDGVGWDGFEYFDSRRRRGAVYAFHGSDVREEQHSFRLRGLGRRVRYCVMFNDHSLSDRVALGSELIDKGLTVKLPAAQSSEIVFITAVF